jgi:hypothetical protein
MTSKKSDAARGKILGFAALSWRRWIAIRDGGEPGKGCALRFVVWIREPDEKVRLSVLQCIPMMPREFSLQAVRCWLGFHRWRHEQELFVTNTGDGYKSDVVIAWDCCRHCCKTRLVHILK